MNLPEEANLPFARTIYFGTSKLGPEFGEISQVKLPAPPRSADAIVIHDSSAISVADIPIWQQALVSGGMVWLKCKSRTAARKIARKMRPFFEGGRPRNGERFRLVAASGKNVFAFRRGPGLTAGHFDNLAADYSDELPAHLVDLYLEKKVARMNIKPGERGLDLGCGMGDYARAVESRGAVMTAMDFSNPAVHVANSRGSGAIQFLSGDAQRLPFQDHAFDFAYTINMLHHLKKGEQEVAMSELHRVLRPGGRLYVFEINIKNPLFRFYMRKIFPRTRRIDRGDEDFRNANEFPLRAPFTTKAVDYYTFVPDFLPSLFMRPAKAIERLLEKSSLRSMSIHYTVEMEKMIE